MQLAGDAFALSFLGRDQLAGEILLRRIGLMKLRDAVLPAEPYCTRMTKNRVRQTTMSDRTAAALRLISSGRLCSKLHRC